MHARFPTFAQAFRSSTPWMQSGRAASRPQIAQFVCRTCQHKFSTRASSIFRRIAQASRRTLSNDAKKTKERRYPSELLIYDAGDTRTAWVSFWKGMALLQFGSTAVFLAPILYHNENEPDPNIRLLQAVGVALLGAIPTALLSYMTAPYVRQVYLHLPTSAARSRESLMAFARNLPPSTALKFQTLRIFPLQKHTSAYLFELRALPPRRLRFANIELPKNDVWRRRQAEKSRWQRVKEFLYERRFKFYVKEGRAYTVRSGVPGVWEAVAKRIQEQTLNEVKRVGQKSGKVVQSVKPVRLVGDVEKPKVVKRQTARSGMK